MEPNEQQQQDNVEKVEETTGQTSTDQGEAGIPASEDTTLSGDSKGEQQSIDSADVGNLSDLNLTGEGSVSEQAANTTDEQTSDPAPVEAGIPEPEEADPTNPRDTVVVGGDTCTLPDGEPITDDLVNQVIAWNGYSVPEDEAYNLHSYIVSGLIHLGVPPAMRAKVAEVDNSDKPVIKTDHPANQHLDAITTEINQYGGSLADRINNSVARVRATLA